MSLHDEAEKSGENVRSLFGADARAILAASQKAVAVAEATKASEARHHEIVIERLGALDDKIEEVKQGLQGAQDDHAAEIILLQAQATEAKKTFGEANRIARANYSELRHDVLELKTIIGQPPADKDLARASFRDMTREEIEQVEKGYGMRGQLAVLIQQAKVQRRVTKWVAAGALVLAAAELIQAFSKLLEVLR